MIVYEDDKVKIECKNGYKRVYNKNSSNPVSIRDMLSAYNLHSLSEDKIDDIDGIELALKNVPLCEE